MENFDPQSTMPTAMTNVEIYSDNGSMVVALKGPLNSITVGGFQERIEELLQEVMMEHLIMDFSEADYVSSVGLRVILDLGKRLKAEGGTLSLVGAQPLVREIFEASGFTMLFGLYDTIEQAQAEGLDHRSIGD